MLSNRKLKIEQLLKHRQPNLTVVLENIDDPFNVSAILRTCDSVGVHNVYIINYGNKKDYAFRHKPSVGVGKWLTIHQFNEIDECMKIVKEKFENIWATHLNSKSESLFKKDFTQSCAIVFGNEHDGISDEMLKHCNGNLVIPQFGMVQSLNVSVACAVTLHEAMRQKLDAEHYDEQQISKQTYQQLMDHYEEEHNKKGRIL